MSNSTDSKSAPKSSDGRRWATVFKTNAASAYDFERNAVPKKFLASATAAALRVCTHSVTNSSSEQGGVEGSADTIVAPDEVRNVSLRVLAELQAIPEDDLSLGIRMERMQNLFADFATVDSRDMCDAITRVVLADSRCLSDEAKAAALRYLGIYQSHLKSSDLTKMFLSALQDGAEEAAVAAARSLGDIGNLGTIPALSAAVRTKEGTATGREMRKAIKTIERSHGIGPNA